MTAPDDRPDVPAPHARDDGGVRRPGDPFLDLTDDARVAEAIAARADQRGLTDRASELATLAGTLRDLAEARAVVVVTTTSGRTVRGSALGVATDHLVVASPAGQHVFVALDAVALVRPDPAGRAPTAQGERAPAQDLLLLERCAVWVEDRPDLTIGVRGTTDLVRGRLVAVAEDVVTVVPDGTDAPTYVAAAAVELVAVDRS